MKLVFFNTPKPRQFSYPARYYDEDKEKREKRNKELNRSDAESLKDFRSELDAGWQKFRAGERGRKKKANLSVLVYIFVVILLLYLIFFR
jgi:hypothetical protein